METIQRHRGLDVGQRVGCRQNGQGGVGLPVWSPYRKQVGRHLHGIQIFQCPFPTWEVLVTWRRPIVKLLLMGVDWNSLMRSLWVCQPLLSKEMQGGNYKETRDSPPSILLLVLISHHRNDVKVPKTYLEDREGFLGDLWARAHGCILCWSMDSTLSK